MQSFTPQWDILEDLRKGFLNETFSRKSYWKTRETLTQYDFTFAERIGWKWEAVLTECRNLGLWEETNTFNLIDWGCGTGIASRKLLGVLGPNRISQLVLWDQSPLAVSYAKEKILSQFPQLSVQTEIPEKCSPFVLLLSHVLNELSKENLNELMKLVVKAETVIWVEPGTPKASAQLIQIREELRNELTVLAPCPHQKPCGLISGSRSSDWCHFFATSPVSVFQSPFWKSFSQKLGVDLRSLPTSFLVLSKKKGENGEASRILGRPRHYKGYSFALLCNSEGVREEKFLTREKSYVIDLLKENKFKTLIPPVLCCDES